MNSPVPPRAHAKTSVFLVFITLAVAITSGCAGISSGSQGSSSTNSGAFAITTASLPNGTVGAAYSAALSASGGIVPYAWAVVSGSLPTGLTLNGSSGAISGTPTASGQSSLTLQASDSSSSPQTISKTFVISVSAPGAPLTITTSSLANGTTGTGYSSTVTISGGSAPYSWSVTSGNLPAGLTLNPSSGTISGTPTGYGQSSFTIQVGDSSSPQQKASQPFAINISKPGTPLNITTSSLPNGTTGVAYSAAIAIAGGVAPYSWSLSSGSLPAGLSLSNTGAVIGTPTSAGQFNFTIQVSDSSSPVQTASQTYTVQISAPGVPLSITTSSLPNGTLGTVYSSTISIAGGVAPYTWSVFSGNLPAGLSLSSNGTISGTPTSTGTFNFTIQVADSSSPQQTASQAFTVIISNSSSTLTITGTINPNATNGQPYSSTDQASGGTLPYSWSLASGNLPPGLSLGATTGTISGTPNQNGNFNFTLKVVDSSSPPQNATQSDSIAVSNTSFDEYGGLLGVACSNNTGWFTVTVVGSNKLFCDPAGHGYFFKGLYVVTVANDTDETGTTYRTYVTTKYGDPGPTWGNATNQRLEGWGFNALHTYGSLYVHAENTDPTYPMDNNGLRSLPTKIPFVMILRPGYYGGTNAKGNLSDTNPIKDLYFARTPHYDGWIPGVTVPDFYNAGYATELNAELNAAWPDEMNLIANSPYKNWMLGVAVEDSDQMFGFTAGMDFQTYPTGHGSPHLGWLVATASPLNTANNHISVSGRTGAVYSNYNLDAKATGWKNYLTSTYASISALNSAWGSNYTTFGSSGTVHTGTVLSGSGAGPYTATLAGAVSKYSVAIKVSGVMACGDVGDGTLFGPSYLSNYCTSGTINYSNGQISVSFHSTPAAAPTVDYTQNGWGAGTGVMDEDGRNNWFGNCPHPGTGNDNCNYNDLTGVNANLKTDLDNYLNLLAAQAFGTSRSVLHATYSNVLYLGPDSLMTWSAPSRCPVLQAAGQSIDAIITGGETTFSQAELDFIQGCAGDAALLEGEFRTANQQSQFSYPNSSGTSSGNHVTLTTTTANQFSTNNTISATSCSPSSYNVTATDVTGNGSNTVSYSVGAPPSGGATGCNAYLDDSTVGGFTAQSNRCVDFYNNVSTLPSRQYTASGIRPYVGYAWWQFVDNIPERLNWGVVTTRDNAYDGSEDVSGSVKCSAPLGAYNCGKEPRGPYGNCMTQIVNTNSAIDQALSGLH